MVPWGNPREGRIAPPGVHEEAGFEHFVGVERGTVANVGADEQIRKFSWKPEKCTGQILRSHLQDHTCSWNFEWIQGEMELFEGHFLVEFEAETRVVRKFEKRVSAA